MYFKRLELNGFKSFADPVTIEFNQGVTCIVGPNGSGKSNISDAIGWVLGEQSPKTLRGGKMEEVIFAGTQSRKSKGMTEVTLVIDNSDHMLPIDYTEVAITRRMYRSGESEYLINKNICRLKDIRELIMDTGIGVEGYSIIRQGRIADIISNKMDSRREIFEEAAGVVKYRTKKAEAERKLDAAEVNLSRVNDIVNEIEGRIGKLKDDSEKAALYLEIKDKSKDVEINIILSQIDQTESKVSAVKEEIEEVETAINDAEAKKSESEEKLNDIKFTIHDLDERIVRLRSDLSEKINELHDIESRNSVNNERKNSLENNINRLEQEISEAKEKLERENGNLAELIKNERRASDEKDSLEKDIKDKHVETEREEEILKDASAKLAEALKESESIRLEKSRLSSRLSLLDELEKSYEGYSSGVKFIMDRKIDGIIGTLGDLLIVPKGYELAIETELGGKLQNIVCKNDDVAAHAIDLLKENKAGRLTFLPVENLKVQKPLNTDFLKDKKGFIGLASDVVKCSQGYQEIVEYVLGNVVLCDNLENAIAMSNSNNGPHKFVTLEGEIINMAGALTGGSFKNNSSSILIRKAEKTELKEKIDICDEKLHASELKRNEAQDAVDRIGQGKAKEEEMKLVMEHNSAILRLQNATDLRTLVAAGIKDIEKSIESKELSLNNCRKQIEQINVFSENAESLIKEKAEEKEAAQKKLDDSENSRQELSTSLEDVENESRVLAEKLYEVQSKKNDANLRLARFETQVENLKDKLWDEFEMSYAEAAEHEDENFVLSEALKISREYKDKLRTIGEVNIGAIEEYAEVSKRYSFLIEQRTDIETAMSELKKVIHDMDTIIKARFKENFDNVVENFEEIFKELFRGGHARLTMEDPDNPLESAIDIEAQPPGKKLQNMNLLSGGEKTLTAIALMFAVLKAKPTPFCILDEIEAALDETNIDTVASYIRSFGGPQFTLITHQKVTMEYADVLYGVTMPESGITQVLSLKLGDKFEV